MTLLTVTGHRHARPGNTLELFQIKEDYKVRTPGYTCILIIRTKSKAGMRASGQSVLVLKIFTKFEVAFN